MKKIILKSLELKNFKGIRDLSINLEQKETFIHGANGSGKTSIFDAFTWLLFDKDSNGSSQFNIKTLDENSNPIHNLEHVVIGVFQIDGKKVELKKVYKEKWTTKRGEAEAVFSGHETIYYYNDAPVLKNEYTNRVGEIVTEETFKVLTSPLHFNQINWKERRAMLMQMAGSIEDEDILQDSDLSDVAQVLREILSQGKSFIDELNSIRAKKKLLKDELKLFPARIDEANSQKQDNVDEKEINGAIEAANGIIEAKQNELSSISERNKANQQLMVEFDNKRFEIQKHIDSVQREIKSLELNYTDDLKVDLRKANAVLQEQKDALESYKRQSSRLQEEQDELKRANDKLRPEVLRLQDALFIEPNNSGSCSTCGQELKDAKANVEELRLKFNQDNQARIQEIQNKGFANKTKIEAIDVELKNWKTKVDEQSKIVSDTEIEVEKVKQKVLKSEAFTPPAELVSKIDELTTELANVQAPELSNVSVNETSAIQQEITNQRNVIDALNKQLYVNENNARIDERIIELQEQQKKAGITLSSMEGVEHAIERFDKVKTDLIEGIVNKRFKHVKFKMFEEQINGGLNPVCECLLNGVPFSDLNTASKINAGLDVINTLGKVFELSCPVFIDNRESVTNLIENDLQVVNLIVDPNAKKLEVK
jgi:exonuclease SbcC